MLASTFKCIGAHINVIVKQNMPRRSAVLVTARATMKHTYKRQRYGHVSHTVGVSRAGTYTFSDIATGGADVRGLFAGVDSLSPRAGPSPLPARSNRPPLALVGLSMTVGSIRTWSRGRASEGRNLVQPVIQGAADAMTKQRQHRETEMGWGGVDTLKIGGEAERRRWWLPQPARWKGREEEEAKGRGMPVFEGLQKSVQPFPRVRAPAPVQRQPARAPVNDSMHAKTRPHSHSTHR
jgi:hypothetical protein